MKKMCGLSRMQTHDRHAGSVIAGCLCRKQQETGWNGLHSLLDDVTTAIRGGRAGLDLDTCDSPAGNRRPQRSLFTGASANGEGTTKAGRPCGHHMRLVTGTLLAEGAWQEAQIGHLATMPLSI